MEPVIKSAWRFMKEVLSRGATWWALWRCGSDDQSASAAGSRQHSTTVAITVSIFNARRGLLSKLLAWPLQSENKAAELGQLKRGPSHLSYPARRMVRRAFTSLPSAGPFNNDP